MSIAPAERVETSIEEIAALEFEPEIPCEKDHNIPVAATWYGIPKCCSGPPKAGCDDCTKYTRTIPLPKCLHCGTIGAGIDDIRRFAPIKAQS